MSAAVDGAAIVYWSFKGAGPAGFEIIGGTSEATPLFAEVIAVADQAASHDLGAINPKLYALASAHASGLTPITIGNNTVTFRQKGKTFTVPGYAAISGYNLANGLGTIDGNKLVPELAG